MSHYAEQEERFAAEYKRKQKTVIRINGDVFMVFRNHQKSIENIEYRTLFSMREACDIASMYR